MGLDSKSYEAYRKNGFVAGIPVFSAQTVAEIRGEIEALEGKFKAVWMLVMGVGVLSLGSSFNPIAVIQFAQIANGVLLWARTFAFV